MNPQPATNVSQMAAGMMTTPGLTAAQQNDAVNTLRNQFQANAALSAANRPPMQPAGGVAADGGAAAIRAKMGLPPVESQGTTQARQLLGGDRSDQAYMAARGATPISTMGSGQPRNFGQAMKAAALGGRRGKPAAPAAVTPNKGRTSSMQRRGIGAGQAKGQPVPGRGGVINPVTAAQNFLANGGKAQTTVTPAPAPTETYSPAPKPVTA
jgi:hypothetical protein